VSQFGCKSIEMVVHRCRSSFVVAVPRLSRDLISRTTNHARNDYNLSMIDENDFRKHSDTVLGSLKKALITAEESSDMEVEDQSGALHFLSRKAAGS